MNVSLGIIFRFFFLKENSREIRVLQTNHRTFPIASSDALPTELLSNDLGILVNTLLRMILILCLFPSPSFRKCFVKSPQKANTINENRQFNMGARNRKFWVSIVFQMKSGYKSGWDASSEQLYIVNCSFSVCLPTFKTHPQLNHWTVTKGNLHFSCFYVL